METENKIRYNTQLKKRGKYLKEIVERVKDKYKQNVELDEVKNVVYGRSKNPKILIIILEMIVEIQADEKKIQTLLNQIEKKP